MGLAMFFVLCSLAGSTAQDKVILQADRPFLRVELFDEASLECCFKNGPSDFIWVIRNTSSSFYNISDNGQLNQGNKKSEGATCGFLTFKSVQLNDTGLYQCKLPNNIFTPGTYMQVYKPMEKLINLRERTKNIILTVEGILLLLCVLGPSSMLLLKSKSLHELEMKKIKREEENIYQGLNLDDCRSTYDQIERSQAQGPYQDVGTIMEETEEIQLEKP
ncbi:B-cell antigen receptor complex-associated protein alpha chain [Melanotaenia boesemani]|uniref:B-cell antigen receptor complex-associated protein alpha chain n=1 Tax=Melanotaenia boesemani TaxID=1250792 RepID=UPI001C05B7C3|nr:B-cell antigen receptor complex-associated protein alpha chain [Melanotaenia boesemani]